MQFQAVKPPITSSNDNFEYGLSLDILIHLIELNVTKHQQTDAMLPLKAPNTTIAKFANTACPLVFDFLT